MILGDMAHHDAMSRAKFDFAALSGSLPALASWCQLLALAQKTRAFHCSSAKHSIQAHPQHQKRLIRRARPSATRSGPTQMAYVASRADEEIVRQRVHPRRKYVG